MPLQLAEDGRGGEGRELEATGGIEALDRLEQSDERDLDEVVARLATVREPAGEEVGQRGVFLDELVAHGAVAGAAVNLEAMVDPAVAVGVGRAGAGVPAGALSPPAVGACAPFPHVDHQEPLAADAAARLVTTKRISDEPSISSTSSATAPTISCDTRERWRARDGPCRSAAPRTSTRPGATENPTTIGASVLLNTA